MKRRSLLATAVVLAAAAVVLTGIDLRPATARGGAATPPAARPDPRKGPTYFDQAVTWVNAGKQGIHSLSDFYADLADVKYDVGNNHHEGYMRLWLKTPDKYRLEMRPGRAMQRLTTKILSGEQMWVIHPPTQQTPRGRVERMHGRSEGAAAIRQLKADRLRLVDLSTFLTLNGLKGPSVRFVNEGPTVGSGTFRGNWLKVRRIIPNGAEVIFHLAYEADPADPTGRSLRATYPGVVTVKGDPQRKEPTEFYLLRNWKRGPQFNYPTRIEAYSQERPGAKMSRFLLAFPNDIRINTNLPDTTFAPPR